MNTTNAPPSSQAPLAPQHRESLPLWLQKAHKTALAREKDYSAPNSKLEKNCREWWEREQGHELEPALQSGAIALLDSLWLLELADQAQKDEEGGGGDNEPILIRRRQDLPPEAFLSLDQIVACAQFMDCIHILMVSHMWLQPDHPDPKGTTLLKVAQWCRQKVDSGMKERESPRWAVFLDFCSLHQKPRTESQDELFYQGLDSLATFFSHGGTSSLQIKEFPSDYPESYSVPLGANCAQYDNRGWCALESRMLSLKDGMQNEDKLSAPVVPTEFQEQLGQASFTNAKDDRPLVLRLYTNHFVQHFSRLTFMSYAHCGWGNEQIASLAEVIKQGYAPLVTHLNLSFNSFDHVGFSVLVDAMSAQDGLAGLRDLRDLNVNRTPIGDLGVACLCQNKPFVGQLTHLYLRGTCIGDPSCQSLSEALSSCENPSIKEWQMDLNKGITSEGCKDLCQVLNACKELQRLWVPGHLEGTEGGKMLKTRAQERGRVQIKFGV